MDLKDLNSPLPKPWLNPQVNNLVASSIVSSDITSQTAELDEIKTNLLTLNNQVSVPNAPVNATTFFSSGSGNLSQTDDLGATVTYATTSFVGAYLPLDGSQAMTGDLDMGTNNIKEIKSATFVEQVSVPNAPVGSVTLYSSSSGQLSTADSTGTVMTYVNSTTAPSVDNDVVLYDSVSGSAIKSSGVNLSSKLNVDGTLPLTGDLNVNFHELKNVAGIRTAFGINIGALALSNTGVAVGDSAVGTTNSSVALGHNSSAALGAVALGFASTNTGNNSVSVGINSNNSGLNGIVVGKAAQNSAINGISIGSSANCTSDDSICIGRLSSATVSVGISIGPNASTSALNSIALGSGASNSVPNSMLVGEASIASIRPNNNGLCDLGLSATNRFSNVYCNGCLVGALDRPVDVGLFSQYSSVSVDNTVAETSLNTGLTVGSLTFNPTPLGAMFEFSLSLLASSVAGDTLDVRWYTNAGLLFTNNLIIPALSVNLPISIDTRVVVRNGDIYVTSSSLLSGLVANIVSQNIAYSRNAVNVWNVTAQWGANVNQLSIGMFTVKSSFSGTA